MKSEMFIRLLTLQKWLGQLLGDKFWFNTMMMGVFTTAALLLPKPGVTRTVGPTWTSSIRTVGTTVVCSASWHGNGRR